MAVSVASGRPYLRRFDVPREGRVPLYAVEDAHRVVAGDVERSLLYKKLIGAQGTHGARMPLIGEIDAPSTDAVAEWIRSGAHRCKR